MILAERYKARRYADGWATGLAEARATVLADAVEVAIRQTTREIDPNLEVTIDASEWFEREAMRVTLTKSGRETEWFEVTMEQALSPYLRLILEKQIASLD